MYQGILIAGFGGQGVVSAGILLAYSGMLENKYVTCFPSYGAEMRGGTANCSVVISDEEIASPVVSTPDTLIVMNDPALTAFEPCVRRGGLMLVNSSLVTGRPKRRDIEIVGIPVNNLAEEVGSPKSVNMVMVGAFCKKTGAVGLKSVISALPKVFTKAGGDVIAGNTAALKKGADACQK